MIDKVINYRYEILEKIGEGSFFAVYKARDKVLNKLVAVKILLPQYAEDRELAERIRDGASSVAGLTHPNIARVYESGEQDGLFFTVVEYVRGANLKERIRRVAPFPLAQAVDVAIGIAEALVQAHAAGIVHGDIRPNNVIVTPEGQVKVTDFGIGTALAGTSLVQTNSMVRHVHYMSPETVEGQVPQPSSDLYSLGVILYEMLTGAVPFDGETPIAIALKHVKEPPPSPRSLNPGVPKAVEGIVLKALQKNPAERYESVAKMLQDLRSAKDALRYGKSLSWSPIDPSLASPPAPPEKEDEEPISVWGAIFKSLAIGAGFVAVVLAVALIWLQFSRTKDVQVPDVVGQSAAVADQSLRQAGFTDIQRSDQYDDKIPEGEVISILPEPGRSVKQDAKILLRVSRGPQYVEVPSVVRADVSAAKERLDAAKLGMSISEEFSDSVPEKQVISQDPGAGNKVEPRTRVKLKVSRGPDLTVPVGEGTVAGELRDVQISFEVPPGPDPQRIRIVVRDDDGENTVVEDNYSPGDSIEQTVQVRGKGVSVRYYRDDKLLKEEVVK